MSTEEWRRDNRITITPSSGARSDVLDPILSFKDAKFDDKLTRGLTSAGFDKPTLIQSQAWPIAMAGSDVISIAKTGSGKTVGFLMPIYQQILNTKAHVARGRRGPLAIIMAPTRELAGKENCGTKK